MSKIRIGAIGCGGRLRGILRRLTEASDEVAVVGAVDPDGGAVEKTRELVGKQAQRYPDQQAMLQQADVDWVMIGSPNNCHREHMITALEAGKHVFCEKPIATTLDDAVAMYEAAQKAGRKIVIGFTLRFSPHYRAIRKLLDDGAIGNLISFEFNETLDFNHGGYIHQDWRRHTAIAGSHLLEKCCHDVDLANWFVEAKARRVASFGGRRVFTPANAHLAEEIGPNPKSGRPAYQGWKESVGNPFTDDKDIVDHQVAIIEYDNDVCATFHTNCSSGIPERRMILLGDRGAIRADVMTGSIEYRRIGWDQPIEKIDANVSGGHGGGDLVLVRELVDVMYDRGEPAATLEDGLRSAITCFGIDEALNAGQVFDVTPMWQRAGL